MKNIAKLISACVCGIALSGCVSIPRGDIEKFTTEYPTSIQETDEVLSKSYDLKVSLDESFEGHQRIGIGLAADMTCEKAQVQHYNSITVEKQKIMAIGFWPFLAEPNDKSHSPLGSLAGWNYKGDGKYTNIEDPRGYIWGSVITLPYALLWEPFFGEYECKTHHWWGGETGNWALWLAKFPEAERNKIGAWTWMDEEKHPQRPAASYFGHVELLGVHRFCKYWVHEPVPSEHTTAAGSKTRRQNKEAVGPYGVFLQIPELGYGKARLVPRGEKMTQFNLMDVANGVERVRARIRFVPPPGGMEEVWDDDTRAMLEQAQGVYFPISFDMPAPRLESLDGK